jgi:hypothetical protein
MGRAVAVAQMQPPGPPASPKIETGTPEISPGIESLAHSLR